MAKRPTPIERAIAGEPTDRQERYRRNLAKRGLHRTTVTIPRDKLDDLQAIVRRWREEFEHGDD